MKRRLMTQAAITSVLLTLLMAHGANVWAIDLGGNCTYSDPGWRGYQLACLLSWSGGGCICADLQECNAGYPEDCEAYDPNAAGNQGDGCDTVHGPDGECSPVAIHLGRGTFRFTGLGDGVAFDIDADGVLETTSWTDSAHGTGLLVLDYNENGLIDSGFELFGSVSPQIVGANGETDGYRAMAMLDTIHGNDDGWLTPEDPQWSRLKLWLDDNHDGISQFGELHELTAVGLTGIEVDPVNSNWSDRHGNVLPMRSKAVLNGQVRPIVGDVLFRVRFR